MQTGQKHQARASKAPLAVFDLGLHSRPARAANDISDKPLDASERKTAAQDAAVDATPADGDAPQVDIDNDDDIELSIAGDGIDNEPAAVTETPPSAPTDDAPVADANAPGTDAAPAATATPAVTETPLTPPVAQTTSPPPLATPAPTPKPMLRTDATVSDSATLPTRLNQGNPLLLLAFAVLCCGFLLLWVRKRRAQDAVSSDSKSVSVGATRSAKVQYSRIANTAESPFDGRNDDDDEGENDAWDDWEGGDVGRRLSDDATVTTTAYDSALYAHPNPFAAASPPASPALAPRLPAPPTDSSAAVATSSSTGAPHMGPSSNSSSDSYEVVTDDPLLLHSSPFTSSKVVHPADDVSKQEQDEDDLFSQFGMVPKFKKSAQPALPTFMQPPSAAATSHSPSTARNTTAPVSASALFAAEMDDVATAGASDDWGEDDEWVQGI